MFSLYESEMNTNFLYAIHPNYVSNNVRASYPKLLFYNIHGDIRKPTNQLCQGFTLFQTNTYLITFFLISNKT